MDGNLVIESIYLLIKSGDVILASFFGEFEFLQLFRLVCGGNLLSMEFSVEVGENSFGGVSLLASGEEFCLEVGADFSESVEFRLGF